MKSYARGQGFTLVELLVVITVIGVLMALLMPAIQSTREAARRAQCQSQLKQLALAALTHHEAIGHFPTGGWSERWLGDADRGFGEEQPGGWAYNVLPFLEESTLHDLAGDGVPGAITEKQLEGARSMAATAVSVLYCPSRRTAIAYPHNHGQGMFNGQLINLFNAPINARLPELVGKLDYIFNASDWGLSFDRGPGRVEEAKWYQWCSDRLGYFVPGDSCGEVDQRVENPERGAFTVEPKFSGVSFSRSEVGSRHVLDGVSKTFLIAEKFMQPEEYLGPQDIAGSRDLTPWIGAGKSVAAQGANLPSADRMGSAPNFGSAHHAGLNMAYCDGSVQVIEYDVELLVIAAGMHRSDGMVAGQRTYFPVDRPRR